MDTAQAIQNLFNETRFPGRVRPTVHVAPKPLRSILDYAKCLPEGTAHPDNTCVIRAAIVASGGDPAQITNTLQPLRVKKRGGKLGGVRRSVYSPVLAQMGFTKMVYTYSTNPFGQYKKPTVAQFIKAYPTGRWFVATKDHAFAIIDGVVHDWPNFIPKTRRRIEGWYQLEDA